MKQTNLNNIFAQKRKHSELNFSQAQELNSETINQVLQKNISEKENVRLSSPTFTTPIKITLRLKDTDDQCQINRDINENESEENCDHSNLDENEQNVRTSKKRGPYKKNENKKVGKERFLETYVLCQNKEFKWLGYSSEIDALICNTCIKAKEMTHNSWGDPGKGFKSFFKKECERHEKSASHLRALIFVKSMEISSNISTYFIGDKHIGNNAINECETGLTHTSLPIEYQNLFSNIYWGCKEEIPIFKIRSLNYHTKEILNVDLPNNHLSKGYGPNY